MRALTIKQPWVECILRGGKRIENRSWRPAPEFVGQRFAIHSSKKLDRWALLGDRALLPLMPDDAPRSAIVGTAVLLEIITSAARAAALGQKIWWDNARPGGQRHHFGFHLGDVRILTDPILDVRGMLGFWEMADDLVRRLPAESVT